MKYSLESAVLARFLGEATFGRAARKINHEYNVIDEE